MVVAQKKDSSGPEVVIVTLKMKRRLSFEPETIPGCSVRFFSNLQGVDDGKVRINVILR